MSYNIHYTKIVKCGEKRDAYDMSPGNAMLYLDLQIKFSQGKL